MTDNQKTREEKEIAEAVSNLQKEVAKVVAHHGATPYSRPVYGI
jgi:hypothetical protein